MWHPHKNRFGQLTFIYCRRFNWYVGRGGGGSFRGFHTAALRGHRVGLSPTFMLKAISVSSPRTFKPFFQHCGYLPSEGKRATAGDTRGSCGLQKRLASSCKADEFLLLPLQKRNKNEVRGEVEIFQFEYMIS